MFRLLKLEDRIVLDGAGAIEALDEHHDFDEHGSDAQAHGQDDADGGDVLDPGSLSAESDASVNVLVVATDAIPDADDLIKAARKDVVVVAFSAADTDVSALPGMIADALGGQKADSIAIAASGAGAGFSMGDGIVTDLESLTDDSDQVALYGALGDLLTEDGRLDLLACNVAGDDTGGAFLAKMEAVVGHDVAASIDITGNEAYGGDWVLEANSAGVEVDIAGTYFDAHKLEKFDGALAGPAAIGDVPNLSPSETNGFLSYSFSRFKIFQDPEGDDFTISKSGGALPNGIGFYGSNFFYGIATANATTSTVILQAKDLGGTTGDTVDVIISIPEAGEDSPRFTATSYSAGTFAEAPGSAAGTQIFDLAANLKVGTAENPVFRITAGNPLANDGVTDTFSVVGGKIVLNNTDRFDYEDPSNPLHQFSLIVEVADDEGLYGATLVNFKLSDFDEATLPPVATVSLTGPTTFQETGQTTAKVTLNKPAGVGGATVNLSYAGDAPTATLGVDYNANASVFIAEGANTGKVVLTGVDDGPGEGSENITITIETGGGYTVGAANTAKAVITDITIPEVAFIGVGENVLEGNSAVVTVTLTSAAPQALNIAFSLDPATQAIEGGAFDFSLGNTVIPVANGATTGKLTLTAHQDGIAYDDDPLDDEAQFENVILKLESGAGYTVGAANTTYTVTIEDVEPPPLPQASITANPIFISEDGDSTKIDVILSATATNTVTINFGFEGVAQKGVDYTVNAEQITIQKGEKSGSITLTGKADTDPLEADPEDAIVKIAGAVGATVNPAQSQTTIYLEEATEPNVTFSGGASIAETGGVATLKLDMSNTSTQTVTVTLELAGAPTSTATLKTDYTAKVNGVAIAPVGGLFDVDIAPGALSETIDIAAVGDLLFELDETAVFKVVSVLNGNPAGTATQTVTILDDDVSNKPLISLAGGGVDFNEAAGTATLTVQASTVVGATVTATIDITSIVGDVNPGDALPADFSAEVGGVSVLDTATGQLKVEIPFGTNKTTVVLSGLGNDFVLEGDEVFQASIAAVSDTADIDPAGLDQEYTIKDATTAPLALTLDVSDTDLGTAASAPPTLSEEGGNATLTATISLAGGTTLDTSFTLILTPDDVDAMAGVDYQLYEDAALTTPLNFVAGHWELIVGPGDQVGVTDDYAKTFYVGGLTDVLVEGQENFNLEVSAAGIVATDVQTLGIVDDDMGAATAQLLITVDTDPVAENGGESVIRFQLVDPGDGVTPKPVSGSVKAKATFGGAAYGDAHLGQGDFTVFDGTVEMGPTFTVTFAEGETEKTFTLKSVDDATAYGEEVYEGTETVTIDAVVTSGQAVDANQTTLGIADEFLAPVATLQFSGFPAGDIAVDEDFGTLLLKASLNRKSADPVIIDLDFQDGTALGGGVDFTALGTQITIPSLALSGSKGVTIVDDTFLEGDETFTVDIAGVTGGQNGSTGPLTVTIQDDALELSQPPQVALLADPAGDGVIDEAGANTETFSVFVDRAFTTDITLSLDFAALVPDAVIDVDYTVTPSQGTLTLNAGTVYDLVIPASPTSGVTVDLLFEGAVDFNNEPTENITVVATTVDIAGGNSPTGFAELTATQTLQLTITDDTEDPEVSIAFLNGQDVIREANVAEPTTTTIVASLSGTTTSDVTVTLLATPQTIPGGVVPPAAGEDFIRTPNTWNIVIPADSTTGKLQLTAVNDLNFEGDESFTIAITNVAGPAADATTETLTLTVQDDDPAPKVSISGGGDITELGSASTTVNLNIATTSTGTVVVDLLLSGVADFTGTADYTLTVGTGTVAVGPSVAISPNGSTALLDPTGKLTITWDVLDQGAAIPIVFTAVDDGDPEGDESVQVDLTATNSLAEVDTTQAQVTFDVIDDDFTAPTVSLNGFTTTFEEDGSVQGVVRVEMSSVVAVPFDLTIRLDPTANPPMAEPGVDFTVTYEGAPVTFTLDEGDPLDPDDDTWTATFQVTKGTIDGDIRFNGAQDSIFEGPETFDVIIDSVSPTSNANINLAAKTESMTINDDDPAPTVTLTGGGTLSEDGGTTVMTLNLSSAAAVDQTIFLTLSDETAPNAARFTDGGLGAFDDIDFALFEGDGVTPIPTFGSGATGTFTVTIQAGVTSFDIVVKGQDDAVFEVDEDMTATITAAGLFTIGTTASATATITDTDLAAKPIATLGAFTPGTFDETPTTTVITVTLDQVSGAFTSVPITFSGDAVFGVDYTVTKDGGTPVPTSPDTLVIAPGITTATYTLTAVNGDGFEPTETVTMTLGTDDSFTQGATIEQTADLVNTDAEPTVQLAVSTATINENPPGSAEFTVTLSAISAVDTTVELTLDLGGTDTATVVDDFNVFGYDAVAGNVYTVVIPKGDTTAKLTVQAVNDSLYEGTIDETLTLEITNANNATFGAVVSQSTDIVDDETAPKLTLSTPGALDEGTTGTISVTLAEKSGVDTTFKLTFTDGVPPGFASFVDYEVDGAQLLVATATFTITAGDLGIDIPLFAVSDGLFEGLEDLTVTPVVGPPQWTDTSAQTVTINDTDTPPEVSLTTIITPPIAENDGIVGTVKVQLSGLSYQDETVVLKYTGDAVAGPGGDVEIGIGAPGALVLNPGDTFEVTLLEANGFESLFVTLPNVDGVWRSPRDFSIEIVGMKDSPPDTFVTNDVADKLDFTIEDDDDPFVVRLVPDPAAPTEISETGGLVNIEAVLLPSVAATLGMAIPATQEITVTLGNVDGTATYSDDYLGANDPGAVVLTIPVDSKTSGSEAAFFAQPDEVYEGNETFDITAAEVTNAVWDGGTVTVTVLDDDPGPTVNMTLLNGENIDEEGGVATVRLNFSEASPVDEVVYITFDGTFDGTFGANRGIKGGIAVSNDYVAEYESGIDVGLFAGGGLTGTFAVNVPVGSLDIDNNFDFYLIGVGDNVAGGYLEPNETVDLELVGFGNKAVVTGTQTTAVATFVDDDLAVAPTISLTLLGPDPINEPGDPTNTSTFTLDLSTAVAGPTLVTLAFDGTALPVDDYVVIATNGVTPLGTVAITAGGEATVVIPDGEAQATFIITTTASDNAVYEGDENVGVAIKEVTYGAVVDTANDTFSLTIRDEADASELSIVADPPSLFEDDNAGDEAGSVTVAVPFQIVKTNASSEPQAVTFYIDTLASTATYDVDYTIDGLASETDEGSLLVGKAAGSYNLPNINIISDDLAEDDEFVVLKIKDPTPFGIIPPGSETATFTITDNDDRPEVIGDRALTGFVEGSAAMIVGADINVNDNDTITFEGPENVVFTVTGGTTNGALFYDANDSGGFDAGDSIVGSGDTFTLKDLQDGRVWYDHYAPGVNDPEAGETLTDSFTFTVDDGTNFADSDVAVGIQPTFTFSITATDEPEPFTSANDVFWVLENKTGQLYQSEADALAEAGDEAVLATDQDANGGTALANPLNSSIFDASSPAFQLAVGADGQSLVLELATPLDFEGEAGHLVIVDISDGFFPTVTRTFLINVLDVEEAGDDYNPDLNFISDQTWTPADDGAFIYQVDVENLFQADGEKIITASGMPTWLHFQTTNAVFWALPGASGVPTSNTTVPVSVVATYYDGNGEVQGVTTVPFNINVIVASLDKGLILDALDHLDDAPADLPEAGEAVEIHEMMVAETAEDAMMNPFAEALALLDGELEMAAA